MRLFKKMMVYNGDSDTDDYIANTPYILLHDWPTIKAQIQKGDFKEVITSWNYRCT